MTRYLATIDPQRVPVFAAATVLLVAAALALYVVLPQARARDAALEAKAALAPTAAAAAPLGAERAALEDAVRGLVALSAAADAASPQTLAAALMNQLQTAAWRRNVELVAIEPREGAQIDSLQETVFDVELVGAYADVVAYLRDVRSDLAPLVVRELSLTPLDDAPQPVIHAVLVAAAFGETP